MKLLKVHVPNFRNLKNVTLTFEPELTPQVFPISSENGGGKSTLLQLVFVLLSCCLLSSEERYFKFRNIINYIDFDKKLDKKIEIARIEIWHQKEVFDFHFFCITSKFKDDEKGNSLLTIFDIEKSLIDIGLREVELNELQGQINILEKHIERMRSPEYIPYEPKSEIYQLNRLKQELQDKQEIYNIRKDDYYGESRSHEHLQMLRKNSNILDTTFLKGGIVDTLVICQTHIENYNSAKTLLEQCGKSIFLASPPSQPYIFFDREMKKTLFELSGDYEQYLSQAHKVFQNFYVYGKLALEQILSIFREAKEQDWEEQLKNQKYGNNFQTIVEEFHQFIGNDKYIFPNKELDSIIVRKKIDENTFIELEPEELSHGELKRLGLYAWIKYTVGNDAIVLIDEIENGLHPDWQYLIARELPEWGNNQYLLATHSFHLCEALTPRHVKEIEPKMMNPSDNNNDN